MYAVFSPLCDFICYFQGDSTDYGTAFDFSSLCGRGLYRWIYYRENSPDERLIIRHFIWPSAFCDSLPGECDCHSNPFFDPRPDQGNPYDADGGDWRNYRGK